MASLHIGHDLNNLFAYQYEYTWPCCNWENLSHVFLYKTLIPYCGPILLLKTTIWTDLMCTTWECLHILWLIITLLFFRKINLETFILYTTLLNFDLIYPSWPWFKQTLVSTMCRSIHFRSYNFKIIPSNFFLFLIISPLERATPFNWINFNPLHSMMCLIHIRPMVLESIFKIYQKILSAF
jgi:isoprenylcysteine carboxyl methyltransferase (ICMT) family protein YpbQ